MRERVGAEGIRHVAHGARHAHLFAVGGGDAGAFLTTVLQRVQSEVRHVGRFGMAEDAEDAAFVFEWHDVFAGSNRTRAYATFFTK